MKTVWLESKTAVKAYRESGLGLRGRLIDRQWDFLCPFFNSFLARGRFSSNNRHFYNLEHQRKTHMLHKPSDEQTNGYAEGL